MEARLDRFRVTISADHRTTTPSSTSPPGLSTAYASGGARIASCDRCRHFKKKCSRTPPACGTCVAGGHSCSLATDIATAMTDLKSRVAWMEDFINRTRLLPDGQGVEQMSTGTDLSGLVKHGQQPNAVASPALVASAVADSKAQSTSARPRDAMGLMDLLLPDEGDISEPPPKRARTARGRARGFSRRLSRRRRACVCATAQPRRHGRLSQIHRRLLP